MIKKVVPYSVLFIEPYEETIFPWGVITLRFFCTVAVGAHPRGGWWSPVGSDTVALAYKVGSTLV